MYVVLIDPNRKVATSVMQSSLSIYFFFFFRTTETRKNDTICGRLQKQQGAVGGRDGGRVSCRPYTGAQDLFNTERV